MPRHDHEDPTRTNPEDKEGNPSLPGIKHINVRNVRDVIGKISLILDGAAAQVDEYLSFKHEMGS